MSNEITVDNKGENMSEKGTVECAKHGDTLRQDVNTGRIICAICIAEREIKLAQQIRGTE